MKYFVALSIFLIVGCSSSTAPVPPYSPGGEFYMATGTFVGTWIPTINGNFVDTNLCTVVITKADSVVRGTITNNSTEEVIQVTGYHDDLGLNIDGTSPKHLYWTQYVSSIGDTGSSVPLNFLNGNGFSFSCELKQPPQHDTADVWIDCNRQ